MTFKTFDQLDQEAGPGAMFTNYAPAAPAAPAGFDTPESLAKAQDITNRSTFGAAFRQDNTIGSLLSRQDLGVDNHDDGTFNPVDYIKANGLEGHEDSFYGVLNQPLADAKRDQIKKEQQDKETLDASGWLGTVAQLSAGVADVPTLIPGTVAVRGAAGGFSVAKSVLMAGASAGATQAVTEGALHATQETRTAGESVLNVGAAVVFGSLLGGGAAAILGKNDRITAARAVESMADINSGKVPNTFAPEGTPQSAGAAVNPFVDQIQAPRTREELGVEGVAARATVAATSFINPVLRGTQRFGAQARQIANDVYESTIYRTMHGAGETTGQSVEALARTQVSGAVAQAQDGAEKAFSAMWKGAQITDRLTPGASADGTRLGRKDFYEEVGRAMRNNDESENPFVTQAAKGYRQMFDHFTDQAIKLKILDPEDLDVKTASSYFSRIYNKDKLQASEADFLDTIGRHYAEGMQRSYAEDAAKLKLTQATLRQRREDLGLVGAERAGRIDQIQRAGEALDAQYPQHVDRASDLTEARGATRDPNATPEAKDAARAEVKRIMDEGGPEFQDYLTTRTELRRRSSDLRERNPDQQLERGERLSRRIADTEDRVEVSMGTYGRQAKNILNKIGSDPAGRADELAALTERQVAKMRQAVEQAEKRANETKAQYVDQMNPAEAFDAAVARVTREHAPPAGFEPSLKNENGRITVSAGKNEEGVLRAVDADGAWHIGEAEVVSEMRNKGVGRALYEKLIGDALENGRTVASDSVISTDAKRVYEGLKRRGYTVVENKAGLVERDGQWLGKGEVGGPAYTVTGAPKAGVGEAAIRAGTKEADRVTKQIADAERAVKDITARADKLEKLSTRLSRRESARDAARDLADALEQELKDATKRQAARATRRGEDIAAMKERAAKLTPKEVEKRAKAQGQKLNKTQEMSEGKFDERWGEAKAKGLERGEAYDFEAAGRDVARDVFDSITGRAPQRTSVPDFIVPITKGPLKDRTFLVPDALLQGKGWLNDDVREVGERYARQMAGEIELTRRFGKADMSEQIRKIQDEYSDMQVAVGNAATTKEINQILGRDKFGARRDLGKAKLEAAKLLADDLQSAVQDTAAGRDLIRGTFGKGANNTNFAAISRTAQHFNYLAKMGGVLLSNAADFYRPAMVHGLMPYLRNLPDHIAAGFGGGSRGLQLSMQEGKLAGTIVERTTQTMAASMGDIMDPFINNVSSVERLMKKATQTASRWNTINYFTDAQQAIASTLSQHRILESVLGTGGRDGSFVDKGTRLIRMLGIDERTQGDIARYFAAHGQTLDGVQVANTERWLAAARETGDAREISRAENAVRTYRTAINTDVNSIVARRGLGDAPLFANTPMGKLLLQFSGYTLGAHSRVMIRGLQEDKARLVGGLVAMSSLGAMTSYISAWRAGQERWDKFNKEIHDNPAKLIGEGLDRSGFFPLLFDVSNRIEKITGAVDQNQRINPIKSTIAALGGGSPAGITSSRGSDSSGAIGAIFGPTAGLLDSAVATARVATDKAAGKQSSKHDVGLATGSIPFNSYIGAREMIQVLTGNSPWVRR